MISTLLRIAIWTSLTSVVASCGSPKPGPQQTKTVYLPSLRHPCLTLAPPPRPVLLCPPQILECERADEDTAALLDYMMRLERWALNYAWPVCKVDG